MKFILIKPVHRFVFTKQDKSVLVLKNESDAGTAKNHSLKYYSRNNSSLQTTTFLSIVVLALCDNYTGDFFQTHPLNFNNAFTIKCKATFTDKWPLAVCTASPPFKSANLYE